MEKKVTLLGVAYKLSTGERVIDYGLGDLHSDSIASSHSLYVTVSISDESLNPSIDSSNKDDILPDIDYDARILSISTESNPKRMTLSVNNQVGTILFSNLSEYWGDDNAILERYHVGDTITVCRDTSIDTILAFKYKDVRIIPFTKLNLRVGAIVTARISTVEPSLSIWYNGFRFYINQKDPIAENRIHNHVYYPGMLIKVRVSDVVNKKDGGRHYSFQLIHEPYAYSAIKAGTVYPCSIYKRDKNSSPVAAIFVRVSDEEIKYSFVIPLEEIPNGFDGFYPSSIPSKIRVVSFDSLGEPVIQFKTLMEELSRQLNGEVFDITLVKPYIGELPVRVWKSDMGMCGTVLKKALYALGDYQPTGLQGRYINGQFYVEKRGEKGHRLSIGDIIEVGIETSCADVQVISYEGYSGLIFYLDAAQAKGTVIPVKIVFIAEHLKKIVCLPSREYDATIPSFPVNSEQSLQVICDIDDFFVLGDGIRLCILPRDLWDWFNGLTSDSITLNSYYYQVRILEEIQPYVYMAERRCLVRNPWEEFPSVSIGEIVRVRIKEFRGDSVIVEVFGVYTIIPWNQFCIYGIKFGRLLYMQGDEVSLRLISFDRDKRIIELKSEDSLEQLAAFSPDKTKEWTGTVYKIIPQGLIVMVDGLLGLVPKRQMLSESSYQVNQSLSLRLLKKDTNCLEFSHLDALDLTKSCDLTIGQVIPEAPYIGIDGQKIWQSYLYKEFIVQSKAWTSRYYSSAKEVDFYNKMTVNQKYSIRICEIISNGLYAVPALMPDYSTLIIGSIFEGRISQITEEFYMVYIPTLNDTFQILFKEFCDWGLCHYETRKVGDTISVKLVKYFPKVNFPVFSIKAVEVDPWMNFVGEGIIVVKNLGSPKKNKELFVEVCGVPVSLSYKAIRTLFGRPWVDKAYSYDNVEELLKYESFEMRVIKFDKARHTIDLMPHFHVPKSVQMARVIRNKSAEPGCWVECGNGLVGYLPEEEIPKGYKISTHVEKAKVKSYNERDGYAILSIKELFTGVGENDSSEGDSNEFITTTNSLKGVEVFEETRLEPGMVVQGIVTGVNEEHLFYYVKIGPHNGTIPFNKIVPTKCFLPELALKVKERYDFQIFKIIPKEDSKLLLRLCKHTIAPKPNLDLLVLGNEVSVSVIRYSKKEAMIVVLIDGANVEGVILKDEIAKAFSLPGDSKWKIAYPALRAKLKATIKSIEKSSTGCITSVVLGQIKTTR